MIQSQINIDRVDGFCYLYELLNPISKEIRYVGKSIEPKLRYRKHLTQKNNSYKNQWLKSIYPLKPIMKIIGKYDIKEIDLKEIELIKKHNKNNIRLTNITKGGDGGDTFSGKKHKQKTKDLISIANTGRLRKDLSDYNRKIKSKTVHQIDPKTKIILNTFDSVAQASKITGCSKTNIAKFCNGSIKKTIKKVGGFHWRYND